MFTRTQLNPFPWYIALGLIVFLLACGRSATVQAGQSKQISVFVSILPEEYFVARIGGKRIRVETLVQPGRSPATYAPTPKQMVRMAHSRIFFRIGVPFENALIPKLMRSMPNLTIIDLRDGLNLLVQKGSQSGELDPHTWLDPLLVKHQARTIRDTLIRVDPADSKEYQANFSQFAADLDTLDSRLRNILRPFAGQTVYVFHPAYGYFCRAYNLTQKAVVENGKKPGARHLARLIEHARNDRVKVIFVQPQFSKKTAKTMARAIGGTVVALDPLAKDYITNMASMAEQLAAGLQGTVQKPN